MNINRFAHSVAVTICNLSDYTELYTMICAMAPDQLMKHDFGQVVAGSPAQRVVQWIEVTQAVFTPDMSKEEAFIALLGILADLKHDDPIFQGLKPLVHVNFTLCGDGVAKRLHDYGVHTYEDGEDKSDGMTAEEAFLLICSMAFAYRGAAAKTVEPHKRLLSLISEWDGCKVQRWRQSKK